MAKAVQEVKNQVPAEASYEDQYAGEGTYTDAKYTITPRVSILQALSPQVKKQNVAYVEGATPGMIYLDSYHAPLVHGDEGILFQPCWFETRWEVRTPRDAGAANWIGEFDEPQPDWTEHRAEKGGYVYYETPDGNIANEIHIHAGMVHIGKERLPYAIKMAGTGVFISRRWNGQIGSRKTLSGKPAARFNFLYRMRVRTQSNNIGEWGQWNISPGGAVSEEDMRLGHEFRKALEERQVIVDKEPTEADGGSRQQVNANEEM
jgi:hypothetical protein